MKSMTKLVLAMMVAGFVCLGIPKVHAAPTDQISVTVTLSEIVSVDVQPGSWAIGGIALNGTNTLTSCTATNDGNVIETFTINGADGAGAWANGAAIGADQFMLKASIDAGVTWPIAVLNGGNVLKTPVAVGAGLPFQLQYSAPSSDTKGGGVAHGFSVTVTATKAP